MIKKIIKILHLEDLPTDAELVEHELKKGNILFEKCVVDNKEDYENALSDFHPDIILSDHSLPCYNSIEALKILKEKKINIPFILITATVSEEFAVDIMKRGAADYILKDRMQRLPAAVTNALDKWHNENERKQYLEKIITNEGLLKETEQMAQIGSWQTDMVEGSAKWSDETYRILGYQPGEIQPSFKNFLSSIHPADREFVQKTIEQPAKDVDLHKLNFRVIDKNGSIRFIRSELMIERNKQKESIRITGFNQDVTEIMLAEEAKNGTEKELKAAHERLLFHMENTPLGFIEWDSNGLVQSWSRRAEEIFGWSEKEMIDNKRNGFSHVYIEDMPIANRVVVELISAEVESNTVQHRNITKDGKVIWCEWFNSILKDKDGNVNTIMSLVQDISKRKKTEENLIKNEARLNESQAIAHLGSWELNFATDEALLSEEACRIYGLPSAINTQHYKTWASFIHPEDLDVVMKINNESQKTLSNAILDHRIILKDGTIKHIHSESKFEFDTNGKPIGLYGISHDVTEQTIAEENLRKSESRLKEAQALALTGNWEVDLLTNKQVWSDELYSILGMNGENVQPSEELLLSCIHPDDFDFAGSIIKKSFSTFKDSSLGFRFIIRKGETKYGYAEWRFEFNQQNKPFRLYGIFKDVTEQKLAEEDRIKIISDLIQRNKVLEQFSYIISHNLRAPVANILGTVNVMNDIGLTAEEKEQLTAGLYESVMRLDNVVKDLNQILQVKLEINETKEKVQLPKLVEDIKMSIKNLIDGNRIKIKYDFSEVDELVSLKGYLYSIFYNLISNSIKYRQKKIPCVIQIKSHQKQNKIELIFSDNGMGIDLIKKGDQVFGLYKRFHANVEGKGMGLFMVKTQIETLGGKISVKSEVNKGTEFKIEFMK